MDLITNHEVVALIPGLAQWVEDLVFPRAAVGAADAAWILRCCGSGVGQWLQSDYTPSLGTNRGSGSRKNAKRWKKKNLAFS